MTHFRKPSKKYIQKYRADWEDKNEFRGWLNPHPNDPEKAICSICNVVIKAHLCDLKKHGSAKKHIGAIELIKELKLNKDGSYEFRANYQFDPDMDEEEEELDDSVSIRWPSEAVKSLLRHLKTYWKDLQDGLRKKKDIWEDISAAMVTDDIHMSSEECSKKFRNMKMMYMKVIRKSTLLGDLPNYRIDYFSDLNELLSDDPEILSYLQAKKDGFKSEIIDEDISDEETILMEESEFDITTDGGDGEWTETTVHLMLDFLQEFKGFFSGKEGESDDAVWQNVTEQLRLKGIEVDENQCRRKWQSLVKEYIHYRSVMDTDGSSHLWPYFAQVRHLIRVVKIPTQGIEETERVQIQLRRDKPRGRKMKRPEHIDESDGSEAEEFSSPHRGGTYSKNRTDERNNLRAMRRLTETAELWNRMNSIEKRLDDISDHHDTQRQTNSLLRQILKELSVLTNHLTPQLDPLREGITIEIPNLEHHSV